MMNLIRYYQRSDIEDAEVTQQFLIKLGSAGMNMESQGQDLVKKKAQRSPTKIWLRKDFLSVGINGKL